MLSASGKEINLWDVAKESITYSYACEEGAFILQQLMKKACVAVRWSPNFERVLVIHGEHAELLDMRVIELVAVLFTAQDRRSSFKVRSEKKLLSGDFPDVTATSPF